MTDPLDQPPDHDTPETLVSLRVNVSDLLAKPGSSRDVTLREVVADLAVASSRVPEAEPVDLELHLERIPDGIVVRGSVRTRYESACRRCLKPVAGTVDVHVDELFEPSPIEGETYPLGPEAIDLEPLVRDTVLLDLPTDPVCRDDCAGLCGSCGVDHNEVSCDCTDTEPDPRWDALRSLTL